MAEPVTAPSWWAVLTAQGVVLTAALAALGYVGKQVADFVLGLQRKRESDFARLVELQSLLRASQAVFKAQNKQARRLVELIERNRPGVPSPPGGFECIFSEFFKDFTPEEKELHSVIRGMTEHSMRSLNLALSDWLKADTTFKTGRQSGGSRSKLAKKLEDLEAHLPVWHAKAKVWLSINEAHALVYLADESEFGVGFPEGLDAAVEEALT